MGKYMRRTKPKTTGEVSLIEVPSSLGGVLTRAKTLALQKATAAVVVGANSYIQLRSRRLVKPNSDKKQHKETTNPNKPSLRGANSSNKKLVKGSVDLRIDGDDDEGSFGENMVEIQGRGRTTRETTPCTLIRNPDIIRTPGSSTKPNSKTRAQNKTPRPIPSTTEMDEFFTGPEKHQQRLFMEKYNFDPVSEKPLNGRYEWVKVDAVEKS